MEIFSTKSEIIKAAFFSLSRRDRALIAGVLASMPAAGLASAAYRCWLGEQVPLFDFLSPLAFALTLFFMRKWPAGFFRIVRMGPVGLISIAAWSFTFHRDKVSGTDKIVLLTWLCISTLALWPSLNWLEQVKAIKADEK